MRAAHANVNALTSLCMDCGRFTHEARDCDAPPKANRRQFGEPGECAYCERERAKQKDGVIPFFPPHDASPRCESGKRSHCTRDACF